MTDETGQPAGDEKVTGTISAKGVNGQINVAGGWVEITRKGLGRMGHSNAELRFPVKQVTTVQVRKPGWVSNGYVRFVVPGAPASVGSLQDATKDQYAVIFTKKHLPEVQAVREYIEAQMLA